MANEVTRTDVDDPYYLHPSEGPGLVLVSPPFDGKNFGEWRRSMRISLFAKNKSGFVTGSIAKPPLGSARLHLWERCNDMLISWLINVLSLRIWRSVLYTDTAKGIWDELEARYGKVAGTQLYGVKKELGNLEQGTTAFPDYFTAMKILWDELDSIKKVPSCTCGALKEYLQNEQEERVVQLLMRLNENYKAARGAILMMQLMPDVNRVYSMLCQEEDQRECKTGNNAPTEDVISMHAEAKTGTTKKPLYCTNCKKTHHSVEKCYFLIGFPPGYSKAKNKKQAEGKNQGEKKFAGSIEAFKSEFTSEQISKFMTMMRDMNIQQEEKEPVQDDFAGFSGFQVPQ